MTAATFLLALRVSLNLWLDAPAGITLLELAQESLGEAGRGFSR